MYAYLVCHISADCPPGANVSAYNYILLPCLCLLQWSFWSTVRHCCIYCGCNPGIEDLGGGGGRTEARYDCVEGNVYVVDWEMALRAVMFCFVCAHGCLGGRNHGDEDFAGSSDGERTWSEKSSNLHQ